MIAIDSSAVVAIALQEAEANLFVDMVAGTPCVIGWLTVFECHLVLSGIPQGGGLEVLDKVLQAPRLNTVAFDGTPLAAASLAFTRYGKGRGHPAQLNFGDCMAYAVAKTKRVPLLYKGTDFASTDIDSALA